MRTFFKLLLAGMVLGGSALGGRAEVANGIKAIVNTSIITFQQVGQYVEQAEKVIADRYERDQPELYRAKMAELMDNGLESLVDRELILHDYDVADLKVPESIIDDDIQDEIKEHYSDRVQFIKDLQAHGITFEAYRKQKRDDLIVYLMTHKNVPDPIISPHKIELYYNDHRNDYKVEDQVKMRMIVLNKPSDDTAGTTRKRAEEILSQIKSGAPFDELARSYSEGSQHSEGGEMGWQDLSVILKPLADAAVKLKPGQYSDVIETPTACFLVQLEDRKLEHYQPLSEVRQEIERGLMAQESTRMRHLWIDRLKKKTFVRYF